MQAAQAAQAAQAVQAAQVVGKVRGEVHPLEQAMRFSATLGRSGWAPENWSRNT
jgi:hypothetical protein